MADPVKPVAPAPAANVPAAAPVVVTPPRIASDDDVIPVNINGKEELVPVRLIKPDYQTSAAGRAALEQAKAMRAEMHTEREQAERYRQAEHQRMTDPEGYLRGQERLTGVTRQSVEALDTEPDSRPDPKTRVLEERLARIETDRNQERLQAYTNQALDDCGAYFKQDLEARAMAGEQAYAQVIANPTRDPREVVSETVRRFYSYSVKRLSDQATQVRDTRLERESTIPVVPTSIGGVDLSDLPKGRAGDERNGNLKRTILAAGERFLRASKGQ